MYERKRESMKNFSKKGKVVATAVTATGVTFAGAIFTFITPTLADTVTVKTATELKTALDNKANQIVVGADIEGSFEIKKDSNTTIDLGGYTVTSNGHAFIVESGAKVSINNGKIVAQNKDAAIYNNGYTTLNVNITSSNDGANSYYAILNHGEMVIEGGSVESTRKKGASLIVNGYYNYNSTNPLTGHVAGTNSPNPTLTINDGLFLGGLITVKTDDGGITTINDGKFVNNSDANDDVVVIENWNKTTINGGEFEGNGTHSTIFFPGQIDTPQNVGELTITGGKYIGSTLIATGEIRNKSAKIIIKNADISGVGEMFSAPNSGFVPGTDSTGSMVIENNSTIMTQLTSAEFKQAITWDDGNDKDKVRPTAEQIKNMLAVVSKDSGTPLTANIEVTVDPDDANRYLVTYKYSVDKYNADGTEVTTLPVAELKFDEVAVKDAGYTIDYNSIVLKHTPKAMQPEGTNTPENKKTGETTGTKTATEKAVQPATIVSPKTGDTSAIPLYTLVAISAAGACAVAWTIKRKSAK